MLTYEWLKDTAERVLKAFVQAVIAAWILAPGFNYDAVKALVFGGIVAALTVLKNAIGALVPGITPGSWGAGPRWLADAAERLLTTFLEAFLTAWLLNPSFDLDWLKSAAMGGVAAALSLLTSILSAPVPSTLSPASLVKGAGPAHSRRRTHPAHP